MLETTIEQISGPSRKAARPDAEWVRGKCPLCGEEVVSNYYYVGGKGYIGWVECWASLGTRQEITCNYRRVL